MINFQQMAMNMLMNSPQVKANPNAQSMIQAIQENDAQRGEQIARNLCKSYGVDPRTAMEQARKYFGI